MSTSRQVLFQTKSQDGTDPGSFTENTASSAISDLQGIQYVNLGHPYFFQTSAAFTATQTVTTQFITAPGAGLSLYVTDLIIGADAGGAFSIAYGSGVTAGATTIFRGYINTNTSFNHSFRIPLKAAANQDLSISTDETNTSVNILGYIAP